MNPRPLFILLLLLPFVPTVNAEATPPDEYRFNFPNIVGAITAGEAIFEVGYPTAITGPGTYWIAISATTTVAPAAVLQLAAGGTLQSTPGCTVGAISQDTAVLSSVSGYVPITVASGTKYCHGTGRFTLTVAPPVSVMLGAVRVSWEFEVENVENTNYNFLCDSTGTTLAAHNYASALCNTPDINIHQDPLSGTVAVTGIPDTQQEIQAIADAIAATCKGTSTDECHVTVDGVTVDAGDFNVDIDGAFSGWELLVLAFAMLAIGALPQKKNYAVIGSAGLFVIIGAWLAPVHWAIALSLTLFGVILIVLWMIEEREYRESLKQSGDESYE